MLTAQQARDLRDALAKQSVEAELYKILQNVAEEAISAKPRSYVYTDLDFTDIKVDYIVNRLHGMGYVVECNKYPEDGYSSLTIRF